MSTESGCISPHKDPGVVPLVDGCVDDALLEPSFESHPERRSEEDEVVRKHLTEMFFHCKPERRAFLKRGIENFRRAGWGFLRGGWW